MSEACKKELPPNRDISKQFFVNEEEIIEKLNLLSINFKYFKNKEDRIEYIFLNVQKVEGTNAFYLDTKDKKVIYFHFHFNGNNILHPKDKHVISAEELLEYMNDNFEDVDEIVYGCCYPDRARKIIRKPVFIIGSGFSSEYRTKYNSRKKSVTISPAA